MKRLVFPFITVVQQEDDQFYLIPVSLRFSNAKGLLGSTGRKNFCPVSCSLPLPLPLYKIFFWAIVLV